MQTNLITLGGGGYYGPRGGPSRMFQHILGLPGKKFPKICLIPTAASSKENTIHDFMIRFNQYGAHPNFLDLYKIPTKDLEDWIHSFDVIFISGGNTRNLLALWKAWDLDKILFKAWQSGVVMSGSSAGAICWYEEGNSDFISGEFNPIKGLGYVKGSVCPHYSETNARRDSYLAMVEKGDISSGYALTDRAGIHYVDGKMDCAIIEWEEAGVYKIEKDNEGNVSETKLKAKLI